MARLSGPNRSPYVDLQTDFDQDAADELNLRSPKQKYQRITRLGPFPTHQKARQVMRAINAKAGQIGGNRAFYKRAPSAHFD